jgi:hypothetical protein
VLYARLFYQQEARYWCRPADSWLERDVWDIKVQEQAKTFPCLGCRNSSKFNPFTEGGQRRKVVCGEEETEDTSECCLICWFCSERRYFFIICVSHLLLYMYVFVSEWRGHFPPKVIGNYWFFKNNLKHVDLGLYFSL